jgi:hypothetical protein
LAFFSLAIFPGVSPGGVATLAGLLEFAVLLAASTGAASSADALIADWRASCSSSGDFGAILRLREIIQEAQYQNKYKILMAKSFYSSST